MHHGHRVSATQELDETSLQNMVIAQQAICGKNARVEGNWGQCDFHYNTDEQSLSISQLFPKWGFRNHRLGRA